MLLLAMSSPVAIAQQSWALKPYAITLPRVTTSQQSASATVPQQAGNLVYNTDQKAVAVHTGTGWGYLTTGSDQYKNIKTFFYGAGITWSVPTGVTQIMVEVWGGGAGGNIYTKNSTTGEISCRGGGAGAYAKHLFTVTPGTSLTINIGEGGRGATGNGSGEGNRDNTDGGISTVSTATKSLWAGGGLSYGDGGSSYQDMDGITGGAGQPAVFAFEPRGGTDYVLNIKLGNGGIAYGAPPGGYGGQIAFLNAGTTILYQISNSTASYPGGGGGCGYQSGRNGAYGLVIIRW